MTNYYNFDTHLSKFYDSLEEFPRQSVLIIIRIKESRVNFKEKIYTDEIGFEHPYRIFEIPGDVSSQLYPRYLSKVLVPNFYLVPGICGEAPVDKLFQIAELPFVEMIELSTAARLNLNDMKYIIRADIANWKLPEPRHNSVISVIDTGIDKTPELKNKILSSENLPLEVDEDTLIQDDQHGHIIHGHGTVIANIISELVPKAKFTSYKAIQANTRRDSNAPDKGWAIQAIDKSILANSHVINMSTGFAPCENKQCSLCETVNRAVKGGLSVVAAVGNTGKQPPDDPGQAECAITVGASTKVGFLWEGNSRGPTLYNVPKPDVIAPGVGIATFCKNDGLELRTGSSIATAVVTAVVASLRSERADPIYIKDRIKKTAKKLKDSSGKTYPASEQGEGMVDVQRAYDFIYKESNFF